MKERLSEGLSRVSKTTLSEKQSVRTTFKLTESSSKALDWLINTNNLKPKEIFDLICSNDNLVDYAIEEAAKKQKSSSVKQTRKTLVISKRVLRLLNKRSEEQGLSRDVVVESLILLFKGFLDKHSAEQTRKEEKVNSMISDFWGRAEALEKQLKDLLDDENPIIERFGLIVVVIMNLVNAIKSKLSDDVPIDPDDMSQS